MINDDTFTWSEKNVYVVGERPAVYELYSNDILIYIGSTKNLSGRFKRYWSSNFSEDSCKKTTDAYKREYVYTEEEARSKESAYLEEFKNANNRPPKCNDVIP